MTAPARYTREEMLGEASAIEADALDGDRLNGISPRRGVGLRRIAAMLRQAAAEEQGKCAMGVYCREHNFIHGGEAEELRERIEKAIDDARVYNEDGDSVASDVLQSILDDVDARDSVTVAATPTDPPPPPVAEPRGTCAACQYFAALLNNGAYAACGIEAKLAHSNKDRDAFDRARIRKVPADGSGFCHLWEAK